MDCYIQNNQAGLPSHTMHKSKFKWMKDLNVIHETIKLLEDNISNMLFDTGLGNIFSSQARETEVNIHTKKSNYKGSVQWGNYQWSETATYWMSEDISKL